MWFKKASPRRQAIREDVAEAEATGLLSRHGVSGYVILVAFVFFLVASAIQFWPGEPLPYREGERAPIDLRAPVTFTMDDPQLTKTRREFERDHSPPVLLGRQDQFDHLQNQLIALQSEARSAKTIAQLSPEILARFPGLSDAGLEALQRYDPPAFTTAVRSFLNRGVAMLPLITVGDKALLLKRNPREAKLTMKRSIEGWMPTADIQRVYTVDPAQGVDIAAREQVRLAAIAEFAQSLVGPMTNYVMSLKEPTFNYDDELTASLAERAASQVVPGGQVIEKDKVIVERGKIIDAQTDRTLREAQEAFEQQEASKHPLHKWFSWLGRISTVGLLTIAGALYIARLAKTATSPRQAWAVCGLLLITLIIARAVVGFAPQTLYFIGLAPSMLATIMLVIAYNQRFALGLGALHGLLVTISLGQSVEFYLPMLAGIAVFALGLGEIRTLGKLIEVGVIASAAAFGTVWAIGLAGLTGSGPWATWFQTTDVQWIQVQSLWAVLSGAAAAVAALVTLRPVERTFNITTAMRLLEFCDANKPLLRRLSQEAPGTFNHSLTVGIMAEAAANAIGVNGLLCRVGAYYHDVGKLSKPQYFIENQTAGGPNRHDKLSPAMSLLIIVGHVKDGIELAREYMLPGVIHPFIAQHHGTTLVEYFYHAAKKKAERNEDSVQVSETEFRYPGPKPQTAEAAIVMICDGCESAVRAIEEPTAGRIETAVHNLIMKRLMDGQFSECDLTLRDLGIIEENLVRTLAAIHHGRVAYPAPAKLESAFSQPA